MRYAEVKVEPSLGRFFASMALDPLRLADFLENPEQLMKQSELPDEVRLVLRGADQELIADRLSTERGGPASAPWNVPIYMLV